jgi:hypothetical protein
MDPLTRTDQKGRNALGGPIYPQGKRMGTVVAYDSDSHSYNVIVEGDSGNPKELRRRELKNICRKKGSPGHEGVLPGGAPVIVDFGLGHQPFISGVLPVNNSRAVTSQSVGSQIDAGGGVFNTDTQKKAGAYFRDPNTPKNMLQGDEFLTTPDGNYFAALRGKVNKIYGSQRAQIIVSGMHDAIRVVCENYEHFSSIGELKIQTVNGRASLSFKGRVDQKSERDTGSGSVAFDIGDKGQLVSLQVLDPQGRGLSRVQLSPSGSIRLLSLSEDIDTVCSRIRRETVGVQRLVDIGGNDVHSVAGKRSANIKGGWSVTVGSSGSFTYGQSLGEMVSHDHLVSIGGNVHRTITGGPILTAKPTNIAVSERILNGSLVRYMGFEAHGANPAALAGYRSYVSNGAFVFGAPIPSDALKGEITKAAAFCVNTMATPGSIGLGGIPPAAAALLGGMTATATDPAVKALELATLLGALVGALESHTHSSSWGPTGPPATSGAFTAVLSQNLAKIASTIVMMSS